MDVREFLARFEFEDLKRRSVLQYWRHDQYLLRVGSVGPLRDLMKEHGVTRIEHRNGNWFFESDGNFNNPASGGVKVGNVDQLNRDLGTVFESAKP